MERKTSWYPKSSFYRTERISAYAGHRAGYNCKKCRGRMHHLKNSEHYFICKECGAIDSYPCELVPASWYF